MKVANTKTRILVGTFTLAVVAAAVAGVLLIGDGFDNFREHRRFEVSFPDASGLQDGAPVKIGGLTVGHVRNLHLDYVDGVAQAVAELEVRDPHFKLVRVDSHIMLSTQGVLGDKYVAMSGGTPTAAEAADGAWIPTTKQLSFQDVTTHANEILTNLEGLTANVEEFTKNLPTGAQMAQTSQSLTETAQAMSAATQKMLTPGGLIDVASSPVAGQRLMAAINKVEDTSQVVYNVARKVDQGVGTIGLLVNDPGIYDDAKSILGRSNRSRVARTLVQEALRQGELAH